MNLWVCWITTVRVQDLSAVPAEVRGVLFSGPCRVLRSVVLHKCTESLMTLGNAARGRGLRLYVGTSSSWSLTPPQTARLYESMTQTSDICFLVLEFRKCKQASPMCLFDQVEAMKGQALQGCSRDWRSQGCLPPLWPHVSWICQHTSELPTPLLTTSSPSQTESTPPLHPGKVPM